MVFRTNFLFLWVLCNLGFFFGIMAMVKQAARDGSLNSQINYLVGYAIFIASIVLYKSFFAFWYIIGWKIDFACSPRYKEIANLDMQQNYEEVKKTRRESSVVGDRPEFGRHTTTSVLPGLRETFVIDKDSDDEGKFGFEEAHIEEAEDRVRNNFKESKKRITLDEIQALAG